MSRPTGIPIRRPKADLANADVDRWVVPGDPLFSHYLVTLSAVFPNGEDFFVDSVRNYRTRVDGNPDLKARVKGFIGQEAMHGREHRLLNIRLGELGYPTARTDAALGRAAERLRRLPQPVQLAITAASEHFTSVLAMTILDDEQTRETLFPAADMELLITWHALEELEHKDVAFDVLQAVAPGYGTRALGVVFAAIGFGSVVLQGYVGGVWKDRRHVTPRAIRRGLHDLRRQQMISVRAGRALLQYGRPGFHPRDVDTDDLVTEWRSRLADRTTAGARAS